MYHTHGDMVQCDQWYFHASASFPIQTGFYSTVHIPTHSWFINLYIHKWTVDSIYPPHSIRTAKIPTPTDFCSYSLNRFNGHFNCPKCKCDRCESINVNSTLLPAMFTYTYVHTPLVSLVRFCLGCFIFLTSLFVSLYRSSIW